MTTTRFFSLLALSTLLGLTACSQTNSPEPGGSSGGASPTTGGAPGTGGTSAAGGSMTTGGAPGSGGTSSNGGTVALGGTTTNGGTTANGGTTTKGGTVAAGGSAVLGGTPSSGGSPATGGTPQPGGTTGSGGKSGTGGTAPAGGSAAGGTTGGTAGSTGTTPLPGTIPAGYPTPTADNYAKCKTVPIGGADNACAGQPSGNICIECLFGGTSYNTSETTPTAEATSQAGNYVVTVTLGGAAAGDTYVSAESTRGMLQSVTTTAGQSLTYAFVVNAREMEGQPKHAGGPGGYPGLDLFFSGKNPKVSAIGYALATTATKPIMVYIASDSTTCDQTGGAFGGWGQMLPEFFGPPVGISNYANSGASSGGYPFWSDISSRWTKGDWIIIQFGHNDKTDTDAQVEANLTPHVQAAIAAGVNPIMVSPPARATSIPIGDQTSLHAAAAKAIATANNIPFIDLTALSTAWYDTLASKTVAMTYHANGTDQTHTNLPGAEKIAGLVVKAIKDQNIGLAQYLR